MATSSDGSTQFYAIPGGGADRTCGHDAVRGIGSGGLNRYFECASCGCVLVRETGISRGTPTDDLGTVDPHLEDLLEDIEAYHDGRRSPYAPSESPPQTLLDRVFASLRRLLP